jgi:hypothetical protein
MHTWSKSWVVDLRKKPTLSKEKLPLMPNLTLWLQMHDDWLTLRVKDFRLKEWIEFRLSRAVLTTPIRANSYREEPFADSPKNTVDDCTKGYDEVLPLILP